MTSQKEKQATFKTIELWDQDVISGVLQQLETNSTLKTAVTNRYKALIDFVGGEDLSALKTLPEAIQSAKLLGKDWTPDKNSAEIIGTLPIYKLRLSLRKLTSVPTWVGHLKHLTRLDLRSNKLTVIPEFITKLKQLEVLNLSNNQITLLPDSLGDLVNLKDLDLSSNSLISLPESMGKLTSLTRLNLYYSKVSALPDRFGDMAALQDVDLSHNYLTSLPESFGSCKSMSRLTLWNNQFSELPDTFAKLTGLTDLNLGMNDFDSWPAPVGKLKGLTAFNLSNNKIKTIPKTISSLRKLTKLELGGNATLKALPKAMRDLSALEELKILGTRLAEKHLLTKDISGLENVNAFVTNATADPSELEGPIAIFAQMESREKAQIKKALASLKKDDELRQAADQRYLSFIQVRLDNPKASLSNFEEASLSEEETDLLTGDQLQKGYVSFANLNADQCRLIVDFLGSLITSHVDMVDFCKKANEFSSSKELQSYVGKEITRIKKALVVEAKAYADAWFGEIYAKVCRMELTKVLFENSDMSKANKSPVLKAYIFFLGIFSAKAIYMDIVKSTAPKLTEVFWMLKSVPETSWTDVQPSLPYSSLQFERKAKVKESDTGRWRTMSSK